jgi:hypothetical protein
MGAYKDRIEASRGRMTLEEIRKAKNTRSHSRSLARKAERRARAEARNAALRYVTPIEKTQ